ncbi:cyanobacterial phytochrome A [Leptolyngbya sp. 'hensonii']|nr:cyanobacterial phytochrome A [Leptolyngbya sp. 'hensonii']
MTDDRDPVYFASTIQPHGLLLGVSLPDLQVVQASLNTQTHLGIVAQELVGQSLQRILSPPQIEALWQGLEGGTRVGPLHLAIWTPLGERWFEGNAHRSPQILILELEPMSASPGQEVLSLQALISQVAVKLKQADGLTALLQAIANEIRILTGFDRVMVYQFDPQGSGSVMAEAKRQDLSPYLGLHFPATDIPEPVREWYKRGGHRFIPDLAAPEIGIFPPHACLDLRLAMLRGVDPCCLEYHQNMGVAALLVIPLVHNGTLWGLISCHHLKPRPIPYSLRSACELLGHLVASDLASRVNDEELEYVGKLRSLQSEFIQSLAQTDHLKAALINPEPSLLALVHATGVAVCLGTEITLVGTTPTLPQVCQLIEWADAQGKEALFHTDCLPKLYPPGTSFQTIASGLLLLRISQVQPYYILWFRPELLKTIDWAGDPHAVVTLGADGRPTLSPRQSFALWQETVQGTSSPWKACELENALDLRSAIVGIVLHRADELARINRELEISNRELDSFAYVASHDLKEPLRGIHNFSILLLKSYGTVLDEVGVARLQTLVRLTRRMESLIDALLKLSRLGQTKLQLQPIDLNQLLHQVLVDLQLSRYEIRPQIQIPQPLPVVHCDPILIREVFTNLLSNAFKYTDRTEPWIEIGYSKQDSDCIFWIRDNGIGIRERHLETIFRLFKRLHEQNLYGGGTGVGLTIARKIIERHGGRIWVESVHGQGSTFYFTLRC